MAILAPGGLMLRAQDRVGAEALLMRVQATYAALPNLEITMAIRDLQALTGLEQPGVEAATAYRLMGASYQRVVLTRRLPDDWRIVSQVERLTQGQLAPDRTLVFAKTGKGGAALLALNPATREPARTALPARLFRQEVKEQAGAGLQREPVLGALFFNETEKGARAFGYQEAELEETTEVNGVRLARLTAGLANGFRATVWVDEAAGLIMRTVEVPGAPLAGPFRRVRETLYQYDFTRGTENADFDLLQGWAAATPGIAAAAGFGDERELFASAVPLQPPGAAPAPPSGLRPGNAAAPITAASAANTSASSLSLPVEEQVLNPAQMAAIVLVEGNEGVGSGFVTKIRGVDFVVTNIHVIGGNEKIRVTSMGGVAIPVAGLFGATGRDLAILRIEGETTVPGLILAEDALKTVKIGDRVAVVGNRRGGGVATQVSGVVRGIGPDRIEVDAPFQPGNSGSPIIHLATGEVIGIATYAQTRRLDFLDGVLGGAVAEARKTAAPSAEPKEERRWFGFRTDSVAKWEAIDLAQWRAQAKRIEEFKSDTEAIYAAMQGKFKDAAVNNRVQPHIASFLDRYRRFGAAQPQAEQELETFFSSLRAQANSGVKDLKTGDYYDFFRTSEYWDTSIKLQLRAREEIIGELKRMSGNRTAFLARLRQ